MMNLFRTFVRRGKVQKVLMHFLYYSGLVRFFYYLNRKSKRIIVFHNVMPDSMYRNNVLNCASCSTSTFEDIIREVHKRFSFSVDFADPHTVTITFDDGLMNQYEIAGAILKKMGDIPAVIFASGMALQARCAKECTMDDQLLFWASYAPMEALIAYTNGRPIATRTEFWCRFLRPDYAADSLNKGRSVLRHVDSLCSFAKLYAQMDSEFMHLRMSGINQIALDDLKSRGWLIGWHTYSHFPLSSLSDEEARKEISPPDEYRKSIPFCFPYGEAVSVSSRDIRLAEECGYPAALNCSMRTEDSRGDFFYMRMTLPSSKVELHYVLSGAKYFVETFRLLPTLTLRNTCLPR